MASRFASRRLAAGAPVVLALVAVLGVLSLPAGAERPAGDDEVPLRAWPAPPYWTPPPAQVEVTSNARGLPTESSGSASSAPLPFVAITPCRLVDTRTGSGFPSGYGPPSIAGGAQRSFTISGQCGIPADAQAVSFNFAVWAPVTRGDLRVFPAGGGTPTVSTLNWEANILALANAAVVALGAGGAITVQVDGAGTVDLFIDVNGYYSPIGVVNSVNALSGAVTLAEGSNVTITPSGQTLTIASTGGPGGVLPLGSNGQTLRSNGSAWVASSLLTNDGSGIAIAGPLSVDTASVVSVHATSSNGYGVLAEGADRGVSATGGNYGVTGYSPAGTGVWGAGGNGVFGNSYEGVGVHGDSYHGIGVKGTSTDGPGILGIGSSGTGVRGECPSSGGAGVVGYSSASSGLTRGVYGQADSSGGRGVEGYSGPGTAVYGYSPSGYAFYCSGNGVYTGSWGPLSDLRLKRDIEPLTDGLQKVLALEAVSFRYRTDEFPERILSAGPQIGLIAQDVEPVMPNVVVVGPDGYLSVDYAKLTPILIEAVKEQQRQIGELKARIEKLEGR